MSALTPLESLRNLTTLNISRQRQLTNLDALANLKQLRTLKATHCNALKNTNGLSALTELVEVNLSDCTALKSLDGLATWPKLQTLLLSNCTSLQEIGEVPSMARVASLDLYRIPAAQSDAILAQLPAEAALTSLRLGSSALTSLQRLDLFDCDSLTSLPDASALTSLAVNLPTRLEPWRAGGFQAWDLPA